MEFAALMSWLLGRARQRDHMHHQNILLFADLNLDFTRVDKRRDEIEAELKKWNREELGDPGSAQINFPFFDVHDGRPTVFRTNVRLSETYDQIAFLSQDDRLPSPEANATAGSIPDGFDYGVFDFSDFFAAVLGEPPVSSMTTGAISSANSSTRSAITCRYGCAWRCLRDRPWVRPGNATDRFLAGLAPKIG